VSETQYWDRRAGSYAEHWAAVAEAAATALLNRPEWSAHGRAAPLHLLDLGTGNGVLAMEAVRRWPDVRCVGVDISSVMLEHASSEAMKLEPRQRDRLVWVEASAEELPFDGGSFDVVASSFLYQFLVDRRAMLAEARRVLRAGGLFGFVTWQTGPGDMFAPDDIAEAVLEDENIRWIDDIAPRSRRPPSPRAAATELRRVGFDRVVARRVTLNWRTEPYRYLRRLEEDDAPLTFERMDDETRRRVRERIMERLADLAPAAFDDRAQLVSVIARSR
jgi:SAM-dependent methyltransferase